MGDGNGGRRDFDYNARPLATESGKSNGALRLTGKWETHRALTHHSPLTT